MKFLVLGLALFVAAQAQPRPGTSGVPTNADRLQFGWPAGVVANVDTDLVVEAGLESAPQQLSHLRMRHQMRVAKARDEWIVSATNHARLDSSGDVLRSVRNLLPLWIPTMVVGEGGLLRRIDGVAQLRKLVAELIEPQLPIARQIPKLRESLEFLTTEEGLYELALEEWVLLAARWAGTAKKEGVPVSCNRGRETLDCATYEVPIQVDGSNVGAEAQSMFGELPPGVKLELGDYEELLRVTLEIKTMLPHEFTRTRTARIVIQRDGQSARMITIERRRSLFTYLDSP